MRLLSRNVRFYVVQKGDTLSQIAERVGISLQNLVQWNKIPNRDLIYVGQLIVLEPI